MHFGDTPRRILALVRGLPPDSATFRQDRPGWTQQDEWMAQLVESIDHWGALQFFLAPNRKKNAKPPPPQRLFKHPDRPEPKGPSGGGGPRKVSVAQFEQMVKGGEEV